MSQSASRRFPGTRDQVARARAYVREVAGRCPVLDEAILLTSELCANAVQHTASGDGGAFEVTVRHGPGWLRIGVRDDGSPGVPAARGPRDDLAEDGRGLDVVARIAHRWGHLGDEHGRTVFFELRWHEPPKALLRPVPAAGQAVARQATPIAIGHLATHAGASHRDGVLAAAERFLASTVESVNGDTPRADLLGYATEYRAHLASLVAACRDRDARPRAVSRRRLTGSRP